MLRMVPVLLLMLAACSETADVAMTAAETQRGLLNVTDNRIGYVFLWDRAGGTLTRVGLIEPTPQNAFTDASGTDLTVSVERGAQVVGGIKLSPAQKVALEAEVARRASIVSTDLHTTAFRFPIDALAARMRADPALVDQMNVRDVIASDGRQLYVLAYEVAASRSTELVVGQEAAAGVSFPSKVLPGQARFRIVDASRFRVQGHGDALTPSFLRYIVLKPAWQTGSAGTSVRFTPVTSGTEDLWPLIQKGRQ